MQFFSNKNNYSLGRRFFKNYIQISIYQRFLAISTSIMDLKLQPFYLNGLILSLSAESRDYVVGSTLVTKNK